jgi:hypothetical protein
MRSFIRCIGKETSMSREDSFALVSLAALIEPSRPTLTRMSFGTQESQKKKTIILTKCSM